VRFLAVVKNKIKGGGKKNKNKKEGFLNLYIWPSCFCIFTQVLSWVSFQTDYRLEV
jgi:hypothetical protein